MGLHDVTGTFSMEDFQVIRDALGLAAFLRRSQVPGGPSLPGLVTILHGQGLIDAATRHPLGWPVSSRDGRRILKTRFSDRGSRSSPTLLIAARCETACWQQAGLYRPLRAQKYMPSWHQGDKQLGVREGFMVLYASFIFSLRNRIPHVNAAAGASRRLGLRLTRAEHDAEARSRMRRGRNVNGDRHLRDRLRDWVTATLMTRPGFRAIGHDHARASGSGDPTWIPLVTMRPDQSLNRPTKKLARPAASSSNTPKASAAELCHFKCNLH